MTELYVHKILSTQHRKQVVRPCASSHGISTFTSGPPRSLSAGLFFVALAREWKHFAPAINYSSKPMQPCAYSQLAADRPWIYIFTIKASRISLCQSDPWVYELAQKEAGKKQQLSRKSQQPCRVGSLIKVEDVFPPALAPLWGRCWGCFRV